MEVQSVPPFTFMVGNDFRAPFKILLFFFTHRTRNHGKVYPPTVCYGEADTKILVIRNLIGFLIKLMWNFSNDGELFWIFCPQIFKTIKTKLL